MLIEICGTGASHPARCLTSAEIDRQLGLNVGTLQLRTGVEQRYVCERETQIDLAVSAAKAALEDAQMPVDQVDLIMSGSAIPYQPLPAMAPLIMREIGIADGHAAAFDVNSTCLSFLTALETAAHLVAGGQYRTALVVSSEVASRALPWAVDPETAALFGDGAGAIVLRQADRAPASRIQASFMSTFPSAYEACSIGAGGTRFDFRKQSEEFARNAIFEMDGAALFRLSSRHFRAFVAKVLDAANWTLSDIDLVIPHQASPFALEHMARQVGVSPEQMIDITRSHGNQIAASIPFALDVARKTERIQTGSRVLFLGTSAGVSFGGMALEV